MSSLEIETIEVTPELAKEWLANQKNNRRINWANVAKLRHVIERGEWSASASQIKFDADGSLIDGQHRLTAVLVSGVTLHMSVIRGCGDEDFLKMDTGKGRTVGQLLDGRYANERAVALRLMMMLEYDGHFSNRPFSMEEQYHHELLWRTSLTRMGRPGKLLGRAVNVPASVAIAVLTQADMGIHRDKVPEFVAGCVSGDGLRKGDARLALVNSGRYGKNVPKYQTAPQYRYGIPYRRVVGAWNAYAEGRQMILIRGALTNGPIPRVAGRGE